MGTGGEKLTVTVGGHKLTLTNLSKVMYPGTGFTKADVISYYTAVAPALIPLAAGRPATRKRWVHGTGQDPFFQKALDESTPVWVPRRTIQHKEHASDYPLVDDLATLTWLAQIAALEIHVPQWQFADDGTRRNPDRLVLDLDPGPGTGLPECAQVAGWLREILDGMGLPSWPVTSGSKGIHLYARLDGSASSEDVGAMAHELARAMAADHPDLVVADMKKSLREGKVLLDWSQNSWAKTTVTPYSLRGRERPWVAAPRTWEEIAGPGLRHLEADEVAARLREGPDPLAGLRPGEDNAADGGGPESAELTERLAPYRAKRNPGRTPEPGTSAPGRAAPVSSAQGGGRPRASRPRSKRAGTSKRDDADDGPASPAGNDAVTAAGGVTGARASHGTRPPDSGAARHWVGPPSAGSSSRTAEELTFPLYVIHEHHARRLHFDLRIERGGALSCWAVPKGMPEDAGTNHLAVHTEDHPLEYAGFEGTIPRGEYGAGTMSIWDTGRALVHKWRPGEVIVTLASARGRGERTYALIQTSGAETQRGGQAGGESGSDGGGRAGGGGNETGHSENWLLHRMQAVPSYVEHPAATNPHGTAGARRVPGAAPAPPAEPAEAAPSAAAPVPLSPMLATIAPAGRLLGPGWAFEMKWDGMRAIAEVRRGAVRLVARSGRDVTGEFPDLARLAEHVAGDAVIDGEIVAFDADGRPSFGKLQQRFGLRGTEAAKAAARVPVSYVAFDLLAAGGPDPGVGALADLTQRSYQERRAFLEERVRPGGRVHAPGAFAGDLDAALAASRELRLEGVMAKRRDSPYRPGVRSHDWLKIKHRPSAEVAVVGWRPSEAEPGTAASVLVAVPEPAGPAGEGESEGQASAGPPAGGLRFAGRVGAGLPQRERERIPRELAGAARPDPPCSGVPDDVARDARWIEPGLVAEVDSAGWTEAGRLRQPVWRGWRPDKTLADLDARTRHSASLADGGQDRGVM